MRTVALSLALAGLASIASASFYQYDDGVSDTSLSSSSGGTLSIVYMNHFVAAAGGTTLTSIDVVWGSRLTPDLPNGTAAQVLLMSDPNQDGDPLDSTVLQSISTTTTNVGTDTFNSYALTPVALTVGQSFFLAVWIPQSPNGATWCAIDANATGRSADSWWNPQATPGSSNYFQLGIFGSNDWTFMIRGNVSTVPEPASMAALALGAAALLRRRRK